MKLIELLKLLKPEQMVRIHVQYEQVAATTPEYVGKASRTPWWLAEMNIDKAAVIKVDEDGNILINVKEKEAYDTIDLTGHPIEYPWDIIK